MQTLSKLSVYKNMKKGYIRSELKSKKKSDKKRKKKVARIKEYRISGSVRNAKLNATRKKNKKDYGLQKTNIQT